MKRSWQRAFSALLTLAMLLSLTVVPATAAVGDAITVTPTKEWDLSSVTQIQNTTGTYDGLEIDATTGKWALNSPWVQVNNTTAIKVPVTVPSGQHAVIILGAYSNNITVGGKAYTAATGSTGAKESFDCADEGGYVTIKATANTYIDYLAVGYAEGELALKPSLNPLERVVVKAGGADATVTPVIENLPADATVTINATSTNEAVATAAGDSSAITIHPVAAGRTTINVSITVSGETESLTGSFTVRVAPGDPGVIDATNLPNITYKGTSGDAQADLVFGTPGVEWPLNIGVDNGEGPHGKNPVIKIHIPDGKQADIVVSNCGYSSGHLVTMTADKGTTTSADNETAEGGNSGKTWTVAGAKGTTTLSFTGSNVYIHSLQVTNIADASTEPDPDPDVPAPGADEVEAGTINFVSLAGSTTTTEGEGNDARGPVPTTKGLTVSSGVVLQTAATSHGLTAKADGETVTLKLAAPAVIAVIECQYGAGSITAATAGGSAVTIPEKWNMASGSDKELVFENVDKGDFTLTLRKGAFLHSVNVDYDVDGKAPQLQLSDTTVGLKMGATETGTVTALTRFTEGTVSAASKDPSVADVAVNGKAITITAKQKGLTTVEVTVAGTTLKETVTVIVKAAGEEYAADADLNWNPTNTDYLKLETEAVNGLIAGLTFTGFTAGKNQSHGLSHSGGATILMNLEHKATITVKGCKFGAAQNLTAVCYAEGDADKTALGTTTEKTAQVDNDDTGKIITIKDVPAGKVVLELGPADKASWLHGLGIHYSAEIEAGSRNVQIWDFGAKAETGDNIDNNITAESYVAKHTAATEVGKELFLQAEGKYKNCFAAGPTTFGDLNMYHDANDRPYIKTDNVALKALIGTYAAGGKYETTFADDYVSLGAWYCNGAGSSSKRYITLANVQAGDTIVLYAESSSGDTTYTVEGPDQQTATFVTTQAPPYTVIAEETGSYKIWPTGGKPVYYRVKLIPGIGVSGSLDFTGAAGFDATADYQLKFTNQETKQVTFATLDKAAKTYKVSLAPGYTYSAMLTGAPGFGISTETKSVEPALTELKTGKTHDMDVVVRTVYTYSGSITGFAQGYDTSKLAVTLIPGEDSGSDVAEMEINKSDLTFTAQLDPGVDYVPEISGVNDYEIDTPKVINHEDATTENITVKLKPVQAVSGRLLGLVDGVSITKLEFENVDDGYTYPATVSGDGYTANLRAGSYLAVATVNGYATKTHVVVADKAVEKDLLFVSTAAKPAVTWVKDVYVGYPAKSPNFDTVSAAVDAISRMGVNAEDKRVTVHIAPGTYREQIIIKTPYISFVNDEPGKEVLLTWYYGIGYKYYSSNNGFYDPELAHDRFDKAIADRWGTTVRVQGMGFRAENITFENSFNRYITDEEIADGVEPSGVKDSKDFPRNYSSDVESKAATERATAICVEANQCEFLNCKFYSSQDTVYTQGTIYFKNCLIEGQTDYLFGDVASKCIFDGCELRWKGYSAGSQGGYITAVRSNKGEGGYLFRNCAVTANPKLTVTTGSFGRPWGADASVFFLNTKLEKTGLIIDKGWDDWSGGATAAGAQYGEFGTTMMDGSAVDTSKRVAGTVKTQAEADAVNVMSRYYGSWVPYYYVAEEATVAFAEGKAPVVNDNGDINLPKPGHTLTVDYSLGEANDANDASKIQWYRVKDGTEVLVKTSTATVDKTYKIQAADVGAQIKVTVTPTTLSGKTGTAGSYTVAEAVLEGYEDPSGGGDAELGDGVNLFLVGDSTVMDYSAKGMWNNGTARNEGSWGEFLQAYFDKEKVTVVDYARGGASSRSLIEEQGVLEPGKIPGQIQAGDYLFIQFGHNDAYDKDGRYVPLGDPDTSGVYPVTEGVKGTDGKYTGGTYKWFLKQYIDVAKDKGAIPVLVTPVSRMYYNADGTIRPHHDKDSLDNAQKTNSYCTAVKQLAQEEDVLLIDGFALTKDLFEKAWQGDAANSGNRIYGEQIMFEKSAGVADGTHNNKLGGMIEAAIMAQAIQNMDLNISKLVQAPAKVQGNTITGEVEFAVDGTGKLSAFDWQNNYESAPYWTLEGQKLFDAIDAKAKELNPGGDDPTPPTPGEEHAVTVAAAQNGTVSVDKTAAAAGEKVTITATPASGYVMGKVEVKDASGATVAVKNNSFTMPDSAVTVTVSFDKMTINSGNNGPATVIVVKGDGAKSETVENPDGSKTATTVDKDGNKTIVTEMPDGAKTEIVSKADGEKTVTVTDKDGEVTVSVKVPAEIPAPEAPFVDVPEDHWAKEAIDTMAGLGLVNGVDAVNHIYDMNSNITRGALASVLYRFSNGKEGLTSDFTDVLSGAWYTDGVAWASKVGVVNGYGDGTFGPDNAITRQELAIMLYRYAKLIGMDTSVKAEITRFNDADSVASWAKEAMTWCTESGIIKGVGGNTLNPEGVASRAECAVMLSRFVDQLK